MATLLFFIHRQRKIQIDFLMGYIGNIKEKRTVLIMAMKYFEVKTKCGHVGGRSKYIIKSHFVLAESRKEAALKARYFPRVKHDQKDAILSSVEISAEEYVAGNHNNSLDPYFTCKSRQEQSLFLPDDSELILDEPEAATHRKPKTKNRKKAAKFGYVNSCRLETRAFNQYEYFKCSIVW